MYQSDDHAAYPAEGRDVTVYPGGAEYPSGSDPDASEEEGLRLAEADSLVRGRVEP